MAKIYSKKVLLTPLMLPKKETISFIIQYSKVMSMVKVGKFTFENISN
jgi:hypothetical protein